MGRRKFDSLGNPIEQEEGPKPIPKQETGSVSKTTQFSVWEAIEGDENRADQPISRTDAFVRHYFGEVIGWTFLTAILGGIVGWVVLATLNWGLMIFAFVLGFLISLVVIYHLLKKLVYGILELADIQAKKH